MPSSQPGKCQGCCTSSAQTGRAGSLPLSLLGLLQGRICGGVGRKGGGKMLLSTPLPNSSTGWTRCPASLASHWVPLHTGQGEGVGAWVQWRS